MPNVEFSHIIVDKGMFQDHMPDSIQDAVEHLYRQLFDDQQTDHELNKSNCNKNELPMQYHHGNEPNGVGVGVLESDLDGTVKVEGTVKAPEVNVHTIEVILHQEHESQADQKESTHM